MSDIAQPDGNDATLHHIGYVVKSIRDSANSFVASFSLTWDGQMVHDPIQTVYVAFFHPTIPGNPIIELVEPQPGNSTVARFLERGGGLHHLCYEVNSLDRELALARTRRDMTVRAPCPAVAFQGRRIAWVYTRAKLLIEYLERESR